MTTEPINCQIYRWLRVVGPSQDDGSTWPHATRRTGFRVGPRRGCLSAGTLGGGVVARRWPRRRNQLMDYRFCVSRRQSPASDLIWCRPVGRSGVVQIAIRGDHGGCRRRTGVCGTYPGHSRCPGPPTNHCSARRLRRPVAAPSIAFVRLLAAWSFIKYFGRRKCMSLTWHLQASMTVADDIFIRQRRLLDVTNNDHDSTSNSIKVRSRRIRHDTARARCRTVQRGTGSGVKKKLSALNLGLSENDLTRLRYCSKTAVKLNIMCKNSIITANGWSKYFNVRRQHGGGFFMEKN